jgi:hypothetical protein
MASQYRIERDRGSKDPPALIDLIGGQGDVMFPARTGGDHEEAFASAAGRSGRFASVYRVLGGRGTKELRSDLTPH